MKLFFTIIVALFNLCIGTVWAQDTTATKEKKVAISVFPAVGFSPETSLQLGGLGSIGFNSTLTDSSGFQRPSTINPFILYTLNNQLLFGTESEFFFKKGWNLYSFFRYYIYPEFYFGLGSNTEGEDQETFTRQLFRVNGRLSKTYDQRFFYGVVFDVENAQLSDFEEECLLLQQNPLGQEGGWLWGIGPSLRFDNRNHAVYPSRGGLYALEVLFYNGDYQYINYSLDLRQFFSIGSEKNIIGTQLFLDLTSNEDIPFYRLPRIGGQRALRGIFENRYIDRQAAYLQTEYRRDLFWRFGAVAFAGVGKVFPDWDRFGENDLKYAFGVGLRLQVLPSQKVNVRGDFGFGSDGQTGLYFTYREAF